jgi:cytochrome c-type biogenesis protein CcmH
VSLGLAMALVGMTSLTLAVLLVPLLLRRRTSAGREAYNLAVYRDQLAEVERDLGRGLLSGAEAEAARTEIGRRILALNPTKGEAGGSGRSLAAAVVAILLVPPAALLLYARLGSPALPDRPFANRGAAASPVAAGAGHIDIDRAIARLEAHLKDHPGDLTGWTLLARSDLGLGRYGAASEAFRHAVDLSGHRADLVGAWGEAQVLAAGGTVTPAARRAFAATLGDPQTAPRSRYYLALGQMQQGHVAAALAAWVALAKDSPADAVWLPLVRRRIAEAAARLGIKPPAIAAAGGPAGAASEAAKPAATPSQEAVAATAKALAGASPDERLAVIRSMVARLAARLQKTPDDWAGWERLGRSYMVLGEPEKARAAYARALTLKPDDAALREALAAAVAAAPPGAAK